MLMPAALHGVLLLGFFSILGVWSTQSFFSDAETSTENTFVGGKIDLLIDNDSYYNGEESPETSWTLTDLDETHKFFNFLDIKPGDWGEDTISIHTDDNNAWACMEITITSDDDVSSNEPELSDGDVEEDPNDDFDGELGGAVQFVFWADDGDNVLEDDEYPSQVISEGSASEILSQAVWPLADAAENNVGGVDGEPMVGGETYYVGKAWCFGVLGFDPVPSGQGVNPTVASGITCDGESLNNLTQTDTLTGDITFRAVQSRHNPNFRCDEQECVPTIVYADANFTASQGTLKNDNPITDPARTNPDNVLSAPDGQFFSLGKGGEVVYSFAAPIYDPDNAPDILIHEITNGRFSYPEERAEVLVSNDGVSYTSIGFASSEPAGIGGGDGVTHLDIGGVVSDVLYVKIADTTDFLLHVATADGFDLDAIQAVSEVCVEPSSTSEPV